jgi:hypothetical protein
MESGATGFANKVWTPKREPSEARNLLIVKKNAQERRVDLDSIVVSDEAQFLELVHEKIYARALGQYYIRNTAYTTLGSGRRMRERRTSRPLAQRDFLEGRRTFQSD